MNRTLARPGDTLRFVPLHAHTTFSFGDGHGRPDEHVARAAELGYTALALTEHGGVSSHFQLEKYALEAGIRPIFGLEAYTGHTDEERRQQFKFHLTILARTNEGYRNLNRLVSQSWREAYYHPTVSADNLGRHLPGLAVLSGCTGSLLACTLVGGKGFPEPERPNIGGALAVIDRFKAMLGDYYFLEVQPFWELEKTQRINTAYELLSRETGVPLVVTPDIHYTHPGDGEMQAILHAVHRGKHTIDDALRSWNYDVPMTYPASDRELGERLMKTGLSRDAAWNAICMSAEIADMCDVTLQKVERLRYPISERDFNEW
jgi:DNA polymerase III subunit alpha